jgi:hypothetical protein
VSDSKKKSILFFSDFSFFVFWGIISVNACSKRFKNAARTPPPHCNFKFSNPITYCNVKTKGSCCAAAAAAGAVAAAAAAAAAGAAAAAAVVGAGAVAISITTTITSITTILLLLRLRLLLS